MPPENSTYRGLSAALPNVTRARPFLVLEVFEDDDGENPNNSQLRARCRPTK
jgi:hypothetical protein